MRHEPVTGLLARFPLNGMTRTLRGRYSGKRLKCSGGAERTNTDADSGRANFCAADQTGRGSTRCRIYMSKRFIVRTENRTTAGRGNGCGREETFLCAARRYFFLVPYFFFIFFFFRAISAARLNMCRGPWVEEANSLACFMCI